MSCSMRVIAATARPFGTVPRQPDEKETGAAITRDKGSKVVSIEFKGYHSSWESAAVVLVKKGNNGNHMHVFADKTDAYFDFGKLQVCAEIRGGKVVKAAWREPPAHRFKDYWVIPSDVKKEALKVSAELGKVLAETEKIRKEAGAVTQA